MTYDHKFDHRPMDTSLRRKAFGSVRPMYEPTWIERFLGRFKR